MAYPLTPDLALLQTMPEEALVQEATQSAYNLSTCCMLAEMSLACLPLCHYDAKMSTMKGLAHICAPEYHKVRHERVVAARGGE